MPPRAAVLAVGRELEADLLLLPDDLVDLAVLDLLELGVGQGACLVLGARVLDRGRAQDAADMVGAERRLGSGGHRGVSSSAGFGVLYHGFDRDKSIVAATLRRV